MSSLYTRLKITLGKANADSSALPALQSDDNISVTEDSNITLLATDTNPETGIIFYPGGRCDPHAYAPLLRPLAAAGYLIVIPNMPLRLAVLDANRAGKIMGAYPGIKNWVAGGHSMGGAMAAAYVYKHPITVSGLFFIASYPAKMHALPDIHIPVTMLYGTHDFITRKSEFEASHERLPKHTDFIAIQGGDHYQFGSFCNVDITATISRNEQQSQTVSAMQNFLDKVA
ncbi:MAG: alpha/beta hydrolase [Gammaproteobacteria bacterium]|nr:alpha/beta hydrolase [Gammaproteobacteria bacterium]MCP4090729.1 alpha/beta hydrolase [Gammaproteobacteria bacterium]MCP4277156.1 alpha/beta hydrolase [Gammaproteobacteria bacterium]MCP4831710.1 alpha/beta hydrolase [Gammaproteobacteria bacterium]MCP4928034.1 alpha/beta hydrolase [Gammaproteobacteria bacterium]